MISTELISGASIKGAFDSGAADADKTLKEEGVVKEKTEVCLSMPKVIPCHV